MSDDRPRLTRRRALAGLAGGVLAGGRAGATRGNGARRSQSDGDAWRQPGGDPGHSGGRPGVTGPTHLDPLWVTAFETTGGSSGAAVVDGTVYALHGGQLTALSLATGRRQWSFEIGSRSLGPAVADGTVAALDRDGTVIGVDATDGTERWRSDAGSAGIPTLLDGTLYHYRNDEQDVLLARSMTDGSEQWRRETPGPTIGTLAAADGTLYVTEGGSLVARSTDNGREQWRFETDARGLGPPTAVGNDVLFLSDGALLAVRGGQERWRVPVDSGTLPLPPTSDGERVYHTGREGDGVVGRSLADGSELWQAELRTLGPPTALGNAVYVAAEDVLYALDPADGSVLDGRWVRNLILRGWIAAAGDRLVVPTQTQVVAFSDGRSTPVAAYPAEGAGSTVRDTTGNGYDGTAVRTDRASGRGGGVLSFARGQRSHVRIEATGQLSPALHPTGLSLWFSRQPADRIDFAGPETLAAFAGTESLVLRLLPDGSVRLLKAMDDRIAEASRRVTVAADAADGKWHRIVAGRDTEIRDDPDGSGDVRSTTLRLSVDGTTAAETFDGAERLEPEQFYLGGQPRFAASPAHFAGGLDDVAVYRGVPTPETVPGGLPTATPAPTPTTEPTSTPTAGEATAPAAGSAGRGLLADIETLPLLPAAGGALGLGVLAAGYQLFAGRRSRGSGDTVATDDGGTGGSTAPGAGGGTTDGARGSTAGGSGGSTGSGTAGTTDAGPPTDTAGAADADEPVTVDSFDELDVRDRIGSGGDADVHRAVTAGGAPAAVKLPTLPDDATVDRAALDRFTGEAETWARLDDHHNIVDVYGWGVQPQP